MNLAPARISALLIAGAAWSAPALRMAWRDGGRTASPNAGWVEAAFAGALGVELGGANAYDGVAKEGPRLGDPRRPRDLAILREGLVLAGRVNGLAILLGTALLGVIHVL